MKTFAAKEQRSAPTRRSKNSCVHSPLGARTRVQRAAIHQIIQPKLTIGQPNDTYEREADSVADRIVANQPVAEISPIIGSFSPPVCQKVQAEAVEDDLVQEIELQRQPEEEKEEPMQPKLLQRQPEEEEEEEPIQPELLQRQPEDEDEDEEEEPIQTKLVQRRTAPEEDDEIQAKGPTQSARAALHAISNQSTGSPIRPDVRNILESRMGADLRGVRVHEDSAARDAAASINARAFTHKNDIWLGEGQSPSDLHLMAHEATHVVQQRGGLRPASREISQTTPRVQRIWNPITAVANAVGSAAEWVGDTIGEAVDYIKERAVEFVREMPGYSLFTVVNGSDPITGRNVERNGRNFIEAGLDVIPNGDALQQKLEEEGALEEAAQWLDNQIRELDFSPSAIAAQLSAFWSSLTLADATRLPTVMGRLANIILEPVGRVRRFAVNVASALLRIVKDYVVSSLINFIREQTNAYPLLTVILERDPISNEPVERTPMALLRGFMQLSESGSEQLRQMEESGSLQRAADWLNGVIERLNISWEVIRESFAAAWDLVAIQNLLDPIGTFIDLYNIFAGPVGRIVNFLIEVAAKILGFIKDALISRLVAYARTVRGYPLVTVILGKDPFSQEPVERNTANIIHGFMGLMENGERQFQEMQQSGAIARMAARVEAAMAVLNFTWEYIRGLFVRVWNSFSLQDLAAPLEAFLRLMAIFGGPLLRLINFVGEIIKIVIEVVMEVMNFPIDLIRNIIARAMQAIEDIKRDPVGFLKNLLRAVKTGFQQFFGNILTHLLSGLTGWLFSELRDANINPPADLSFRSILGFVLEVLGITVERIWQKLAERIGQERVARIRGMIDRLTGIWTFVKDVMTRGPVAIWEYIQERLSNLWNTVLEAVRSWVMTRIVERITVRLLSMLDPTGIMAVVNGFIAFYSAVQSFIRYLREMLEIVNSFVVGVAELARGSATTAANYLENSLARAMPVAIGFLANQVGLSGIGRRIGEMIERVRAMVDRALTWLVDRAVSAGESLISMGRSAVSSVTEWWRSRKAFRANDGSSHELFFRGRGAGVRLILSSDDAKEIRIWVRDRRNELRDKGELDSAKDAALNTIANQLIPEIEATTNPATASGGSSSVRPVDQILTSLSDNVAIVGVGGPSVPVPPMLVSPGFSSSIATNTEAKFIYDAEGNHQAGTPSSSYSGDLSGAMTAIANLGIRSGEWVRFHLINRQLGGQAVHSNLVPAPATFNSQYEGAFEDPMKGFYQEKQKPLWFNISVSHWAGAPPFVRSLTVRGGKMKTENNQWTPDRGITPWRRTNIQKPAAPVPGATVTLNDHIQTGRESADNTAAREYGLFRGTVQLLRVRGQRLTSVAQIRSAIGATIGSEWTDKRKQNHIRQLDNSIANGVISNSKL